MGPVAALSRVLLVRGVLSCCINQGAAETEALPRGLKVRDELEGAAVRK